MNRDGTRTLVCGASGTGKTLSTRAAVHKAPRLFAWDPKGAWAKLDRCTPLYSRTAALDAVRRVGAGPARLAFVSANRGDFDWWAELAYRWGQWGAQHGRYTDVIAEETGNVTHPGKASPGYHLLVSQSREFAINLWALMQRPAESDKTTVGNVSRFRVFQLHRDIDRKYMARELDCNPDLIAKLEPLAYLERDMSTGVLKKFCAKNGKPFPKWAVVHL